MVTNTDVSIIARLHAHDPSALEAVIERYGSRLYRVAVGITRSRDDAEEVVQDAFVTLFRKIDGFEGRAGLGTWLYRVAANAALSRHRRHRAEREVSLEEHLPTFDPAGRREGDRASLLADWSMSPETELVTGEARRLVRDALARLPEHYRAVVVLRDIEELSNEDVAVALGLSVANVKSRLHRARMALREVLTRRLFARRLGASRSPSATPSRS